MKYLTPLEFAKIVGLTRRTLYRWIEKGHLDIKKTPSGKIFIAESQVPSFMRKGKEVKNGII